MGTIMLKEFKDFAMKGNVVDMAVGVIIAGAFGLIIKSLVGDILMPVVGAVFGGLDFTNYFVGLNDAVTSGVLAEAQKQGAVLAYGSFITAVVNFIIVAFILFMIIKAMNNAKKKEEEASAAPAEPPAQEILLSEIRDLLKK